MECGITDIEEAEPHEDGSMGFISAYFLFCGNRSSMMMEQIVLIVGCLIFGLLGTAHLIYTFFTNKFDAYDPAVTEAMKRTSPVLTRETSMWKAWVGFNVSHSLGPILFSSIYIPLTTSYFEVIEKSIWLSILPVLVGLTYLVLAKKYWFTTPFIGILISTICFGVAATLINT